MQFYAKANSLTEFISMQVRGHPSLVSYIRVSLTPRFLIQNFHNAMYREEEREVVPLLQDLGVGMIPWSPLAR